LLEICCVVAAGGVLLVSSYATGSMEGEGTPVKKGFTS